MQWVKKIFKKGGVSSSSNATPDIEDLSSCRSCDDPCTIHPKYPEALASKVDTSSALEGSVKAYAIHVLICTGHANWPERIESEKGTLARAISNFADANRHLRILVSACDAPSASFSTDQRPAKATTANAPAMDLLIFPPGVRVFDVTPQMVPKVLSHFVSIGTVLPADVPAVEEERPEKSGGADSADEEDKQPAVDPDSIEVKSEALDPSHRHVLICSHKIRDKRCGVFGKYW